MEGIRLGVNANNIGMAVKNVRQCPRSRRAPMKSSVDTGLVTVTFRNPDSGETESAQVAQSLTTLFSYAHQWAGRVKPDEQMTLTFSSMLAAMIAGPEPLCAWLRQHLDLRGVRSKTMTMNYVFQTQPLPDVMTTTASFRTAFTEARRLYGDAGQPAGGIGVRHFMAAYAVIPHYHLKDFLRLRIDRRAWCLSLAGYLARTTPNEREAWTRYAALAQPVAEFGFSTDAPDGQDLLNIERE